MSRLKWHGAIAAAVLLCAPHITRAQTELLSIDLGPYGASSVAMSADARVMAISTAGALVPQDTDMVDLYLFDRGTSQWARAARSVLFGGYEIASRQGDLRPEVIGVSDDGRYVGVVVRWYGGSVSTTVAIVRYDRQANTRDVLFDESSGVLSGHASMSRDGRTFAWLAWPRDPLNPSIVDPAVRVYARTVGAPVQEVGTSCDGYQRGGPASCAVGLALSGDGQQVAYTAAFNAATGAAPALAIVALGTGERRYFPEVQGPHAANVTASQIVTGDGVFDVTSRRLDRLTPPLAAPYAPSWPGEMSDDGALVLVRDRATYMVSGIFDRRSGSLIPIPNEYVHAITPDGRTVLTSRYTGSTTQLVWRTLDADNDGMLDDWETRYGLSPTDAADAALDSDGDGVTNAQEFAVRSHPKALTSAQRVFAEGAAGAFFDTQVHVFNPGATTANVVVGFLSPTGSRTSQAVTLPAKGRTTLASCCLGTMTADEFSTVVESDVPVVAERGMSWDRVTGYGSHATAGAAAPATEWYFAEGATISGLQLFYLFSNPGATTAIVDVEYLLASGSAVTRQYTVPARSRRTIWVNYEGAPLDAAEISARIVSSQPIVAERATYLDRPGQPFSAGSASAGVTAPALEWRFAEGATGPFFDTFLLLANPGTMPVDVQATFQRPDGVTVQKTYPVPARTRRTVWVDNEDLALADTAVSTLLIASGGIVAERAMWWPGPTPATWAESHTEVGATATATMWAAADAMAGRDATTSTFLLIANPGTAAGRARVTLYGTFGEVAATREYALPATSRTTASLIQDFPQISSGLFSAIVESLPDGATPAVPITVERASYSLDFAAGSAVSATALPPPN